MYMIIAIFYCVMFQQQKNSELLLNTYKGSLLEQGACSCRVHPLEIV